MWNLLKKKPQTKGWKLGIECIFLVDMVRRPHGWVMVKDILGK